MKYILVIFLSIYGVMSISAQSNTDLESVNEIFADYKKAMLNGEGDVAANLLSSSSLSYYNEILDKTLNASKEEVTDMSIVDKTTILGARHKLGKKEASKMDGIAFFKYAIEAGLIGKDLVNGLEIANIDVDKDKATADVITGGIETGVKLGFAKESDGWRIDITSIYPSTNQLLDNMIKMMGQDENDFVFNLIERNTGEKPTETVWEPLIN